jgi:hypothetical protein
MTFSFYVGVSDSLMQRMQLFFSIRIYSTFSWHRVARFIINIRKKVNDLLNV